MSTFKCEVVPVVLEPHPDADSLSIVKVWGYTVVVKTNDWTGVDRGVYIPPDSVVPDNDRFHWLYEARVNGEVRPIGAKRAKRHGRITVRKVRGVVSQGLLVPIAHDQVPGYDGIRDVPVEMGTDMATEWGITHYEPPVSLETGGDNVHGPSIYAPKYDVESLSRYPHCIPEGTPVSITEKVHGCNGRYVCWSGYSEVDGGLPLEMFCGSRTVWKKESESSVWWQALRQNPWIEEWCRNHKDHVLYGEVFGQVQNLRYGARPGQLFFRAFDVLRWEYWLDVADFCLTLSEERRMPVLYEGPFSVEKARELAEQDSVVCPGQLSEGVVITPLTECTHEEIGRVKLKMVSNRYLGR